MPLGTRKLGFSPQDSASSDRKTAIRNKPRPAGARAGRLPLGRDALRLLLPASTPNDPPGRPTRKNCSAKQQAQAARLGDSFYFAKCEIVESLLRRGARWFERTGLKPAGLRLRRGGAPKGRLIGLTGEKPAPSARGTPTKPQKNLNKAPMGPPTTVCGQKTDFSRSRSTGSPARRGTPAKGSCPTPPHRPNKAPDSRSADRPPPTPPNRPQSPSHGY